MTKKTHLENWYKTNLKNYNSQIVLSSFCNDTTYTTSGNSYYFGSYNRIRQNAPSLLCPDTLVDYGGYYKLKIGLLNTDEIVMGGYSASGNNSHTSNYLNHFAWTLTLSVKSSSGSQARIYNPNSSGGLADYTSDNSRHIFPVINIKSSSIVTGGDGTEASPYQIYSPN